MCLPKGLVFLQTKTKVRKKKGKKHQPKPQRKEIKTKAFTHSLIHSFTIKYTTLLYIYNTEMLRRTSSTFHRI